MSPFPEGAALFSRVRTVEKYLNHESTNRRRKDFASNDGMQKAAEYNSIIEQMMIYMYVSPIF